MQKECPRSGDQEIAAKYAGDSGPASRGIDLHPNQLRLHGAVQACYLEGVRKCYAHTQSTWNVSSDALMLSKMANLARMRTSNVVNEWRVRTAGTIQSFRSHSRTDLG